MKKLFKLKTSLIIATIPIMMLAFVSAEDVLFISNDEEQRFLSLILSFKSDSALKIEDITSKMNISANRFVVTKSDRDGRNYSVQLTSKSIVTFCFENDSNEMVHASMWKYINTDELENLKNGARFLSFPIFWKRPEGVSLNPSIRYSEQLNYENFFEKTPDSKRK